MAASLKDISNQIELIAPIELSEKWDNCGWQIHCGQRPVNKVLVALSVTPEVMQKALNENFDVIVSHHPIIFNGINSITPSTLMGTIVLDAVKNDISIYSAHTNMDKIENGVSDILAKKLELNNIRPMLPETKFPHIGMGRLGELDEPYDLLLFLDKIKNILEIDSLRVVNQINKSRVQKIALCGGAGSGLITHLPPGIDLYLTGDIKYHEALNAIHYILVDANHSNTEQLIVEKIIDILKPLNIEIEGTKTTNPWIIY